jgi:ABC-type transporter Mla subunit MlaD
MQPEALPPRELALVLAQRAEALAHAIASAADLEQLESLISERAGVIDALERTVAAAAVSVRTPGARDAVRLACERALDSGAPAVAHLTEIRDTIGKALTQLDAGTHAADSYMVRSTTGRFDAIR